MDDDDDQAEEKATNGSSSAQPPRATRKVRRAHSVGTPGDASSTDVPVAVIKRRLRPQSVGAISTQRGRLSLQTVADTIEITGADGSKQVMGRLSLSLVNHRPEGSEGQDVVLGQTSLLLPAGKGEGGVEAHKAAGGQQRQRRSQSVTVSLEEQVEKDDAAADQPPATTAVNVDIEQSEGLRVRGERGKEECIYTCTYRSARIP